MLYRSKVMLAILSLLFCTTAIADTVHLKNSTSPEKWKLDEHITGLSITTNGKFNLYVNGLVKGKDGKMYRADTVTVDCNGLISKVIANSATICELKDGNDMSEISVAIAPEDFSHGSSGWYNIL